MNCADCPNVEKCGQQIFFHGVGVLCPHHPEFVAEEEDDAEE